VDFWGKEFFYFTSLLSYLACQRRIILQVTFAILLDGQLLGLVGVRLKLGPGRPGHKLILQYFKDLTDQWIIQRKGFYQAHKLVKYIKDDQAWICRKKELFEAQSINH